MPRVYVSIQEYPLGFYVVFYAGKQSIGPIRRYRSEETIFQLLRRAHANLETLNIVEHAIRNRTPCTVDLNLTDEQFISCPDQGSKDDPATLEPCLQSARKLPRLHARLKPSPTR